MGGVAAAAVGGAMMVVCDHRPPSTIALFLDELAALEEEQGALGRAMVSAFSLAPAVATDILSKGAT